MEISRNKNIFKNVLPAILANACVFLFSVVDGIFVGNGAGSQALGAVNLALPFVLLAQALNAMASIGGVTITAIRFGRGDKDGAQKAFMHSFTMNAIVGILITLCGSVFNDGICVLLGASEGYLPLVKEYIFWYALFAVPNALSLNLQSFCRNDGSPGLVATTNVVSTGINIFLDWLFVFPMGMGVKGAAIATGISQTVGLLIILTHYVFKKGNLRICKYKPDSKLFRKIIFRGLPEGIAQFSTPVTTLCMNYSLMSTYGDIEEMKQELDKIQFYCPHKSYIVNMDYIQSFDKGVVLLKNGEKVKVSRLKMNEFKEKFYEYLRGRANGI